MRNEYDVQYLINVPGLKGEFGKLMPHNNMNYQDYSDRCSDVEEKHHMNEKYLFPYTGKGKLLFYFLFLIFTSYS